MRHFPASLWLATVQFVYWASPCFAATIMHDSGSKEGLDSSICEVSITTTPQGTISMHIPGTSNKIQATNNNNIINISQGPTT